MGKQAITNPSNLNLIQNNRGCLPIGAQLRTARRERGLSQYALADRVGMGRKHYQRIESGLQMPQLRTLQQIASELGVQLALVKKEASE